MPINPRQGTAASSTNPDTWSDYAEAVAMVSGDRADGLGFVLTAGSGLVCIDLDECRNPETDDVAPEAMAIVEALDSYTEVSPSGTGLHIWILATIPGKRNRTGKIEMYETGRYMTVTADPLAGYAKPIRNAQEELDELYASIFPAKQEQASPDRPAPTLDLDSKDIIERASNAANGAKFRSLYDAGDTSAYGGDDSAADSALCTMLAWWTKKPEQILEIWRSSALHRDKTDREDYAKRTIANALEVVGDAGYDPDRWQRAADRLIPSRRQGVTVDRQDSTGDAPQTIEELRAELEAVRAERDALAAERDEYRDAFNAVLSIVRIESLDASTRLTALGVVLLGMEFQAKGRKPTKHGHHMPAAWIGRYSGQKPQTVNRQLKRLEEAELIDRKVKDDKIRQNVEMVDDDGVLTRDVYERNGKRNYITLPDNVIDIVPRLAGYEKPEDAPQRGGARVRVRECDKHPGAELVVQKHYYCEGCYIEAQAAGAPIPPPLMVSDPKRAQRAEIEPEDESPIKHESDYPTVDIGPIKLERDPDEMAQRSFAWTSPARDIPNRKPSHLCIENGCMNPLSPGARYYCDEHGGRVVREEVAS